MTRSPTSPSHHSFWQFLAVLALFCVWGSLVDARPVSREGGNPLAPLLADQAGQQALAGSDWLRIRSTARKGNQLPVDSDLSDGWPVSCAADAELLPLRRTVAGRPLPVICHTGHATAYRLPSPRGPPTA